MMKLSHLPSRNLGFLAKRLLAVGLLPFGQHTSFAGWCDDEDNSEKRLLCLVAFMS